MHVLCSRWTNGTFLKNRAIFGLTNMNTNTNTRKTRSHIWNRVCLFTTALFLLVLVFTFIFVSELSARAL